MSQGFRTDSAQPYTTASGTRDQERPISPRPHSFRRGSALLRLRSSTDLSSLQRMLCDSGLTFVPRSVDPTRRRSPCSLYRSLSCRNLLPSQRSRPTHVRRQGRTQTVSSEGSADPTARNPEADGDKGPQVAQRYHPVPVGGTDCLARSLQKLHRPSPLSGGGYRDRQLAILAQQVSTAVLAWCARGPC